MSESQLPTISVIIPTYNWSSALRVAIESVLHQTFKNFEVLVVGDGCTDDSAEVVASFGDSRLHWHNLPTNHGSQWAPNNYALGIAKGEFIAYLGHDDLWWPTHLELALAKIRETGADIVAAGAVLYGPSDFGVGGLFGFFPNGTYNSRYFVPPSAMLHRAELAARVSGWRSTEEAVVAVDADFLERCCQAGAVVVPTLKLTVFRFPAAWRRDAYQIRSASEQQTFLDRMRTEGESMLATELTGALYAATVGRVMTFLYDPAWKFKAEDLASVVRTFKGKDKRKNLAPPIVMKDKRRYSPPEKFQGLEWHPIETHAEHGTFRWSGPSPISTIVLPEPIDHPIEVTLQVVNWVTKETLKTAQLSINGVACDVRIASLSSGGVGLKSHIHPNLIAVDDRAEMRITLTLDKTWRPMDVGNHDDSRWLGLAIGWVDIDPPEQ